MGENDLPIVDNVVFVGELIDSVGERLSSFCFKCAVSRKACDEAILVTKLVVRFFTDKFYVSNDFSFAKTRLGANVAAWLVVTAVAV